MTRRVWLLLGLGVLLAVVAVLAVRGLDGDDGQAEGVRVQSIDDLAERLGCSPFEKEPEPGPVAQVAGSGTCVLGNDRLTLSYFASTQDRDDWGAQAEQFAEVAPPDVQTLIGENWAVQGTANALGTVQANLGGDLVP